MLKIEFEVVVWSCLVVLGILVVCLSLRCHSLSREKFNLEYSVHQIRIEDTLLIIRLLLGEVLCMIALLELKPAEQKQIDRWIEKINHITTSDCKNIPREVAYSAGNIIDSIAMQEQFKKGDLGIFVSKAQNFLHIIADMLEIDDMNEYPQLKKVMYTQFFVLQDDLQTLKRGIEKS